MKTLFQKLSGLFLDFIFPPVCPACKERLETFVQLCSRCQQELQSKCRLQIHKDQSDFAHLTGTRYFDHAVTFWKYSDELDQLVRLVKYHGKRKLGKAIGKVAGEALQASGLEKAEQILPVPLHAKRLSERGYNQSEWIARGLAAETGLQVRHVLMQRKKNTQTQTQLNADQRKQNVRNAFELTDCGEVAGKIIYVLDDVITTGATLNECARLLKANGASRVYGIALARPKLNMPL